MLAATCYIIPPFFHRFPTSSVSQRWKEIPSQVFVALLVVHMCVFVCVCECQDPLLPRELLWLAFKGGDHFPASFTIRSATRDLHPLGTSHLFITHSQPCDTYMLTLKEEKAWDDEIHCSFLDRSLVSSVFWVLQQHANMQVTSFPSFNMERNTNVFKKCSCLEKLMVTWNWNTISV